MTQKPTISADHDITDLADAWDRCHRADWMLWLCSVLGLLSDRERRLIACKVVRETPIGDGRTVWDLLTGESRHAVVIAERYADGDATDKELAAATADASDAAYAAASAVARARATRSDAADAAEVAAAMTAYVAALAAAKATMSDAAYAAYAAATTAAYAATADAAYAAQADIIREIAGNPFRDSDA
ncbi:MAG: hypothetical protein GX174_13710 [Lentisphaerae bacterium]|nr:hypothetical protein [Lentisphaerota bacterium]